MSAERSPRVIVGVQESIAGYRALRVAVAEAQRRGAVLHAVRAEDVGSTWQGPPPAWAREIEREATDTVIRAFTAALGAMPSDVAVRIVPLLGPAAHVLVEYAHRDDDLLFVGSGQRGWLRRMFRRSVARHCATQARCPVAVVPLDSFARQACHGGLLRALRRDPSPLTER